MEEDSDEEEQGQTLANFLYGNVDEHGRLEGADYLPEVRFRCACAREATGYSLSRYHSRRAGCQGQA